MLPVHPKKPTTLVWTSDERDITIFLFEVGQLLLLPVNHPLKRVNGIEPFIVDNPILSVQKSFKSVGVCPAT